MEIEERRREEGRDFCVINGDNDELPEWSEWEEAFPEESERNDVGPEPVEMDDLQCEECRRNNKIPLVVPLVPVPKSTDPLLEHGHSVASAHVTSC